MKTKFIILLLITGLFAVGLYDDPKRYPTDDYRLLMLKYMATPGRDSTFTLSFDSLKQYVANENIGDSIAAVETRTITRSDSLSTALRLAMRDSSEQVWIDSSTQANVVIPNDLTVHSELTVDDSVHIGDTTLMTIGNYLECFWSNLFWNGDAIIDGNFEATGITNLDETIINDELKFKSGGQSTLYKIYPDTVLTIPYLRLATPHSVWLDSTYIDGKLSIADALGNVSKLTSSEGRLLISDGVTMTSGTLIFGNGASFNNAASDSLEIKEDKIELDGAVTVTGNIDIHGFLNCDSVTVAKLKFTDETPVAVVLGGDDTYTRFDGLNLLTPEKLGNISTTTNSIVITKYNYYRATVDTSVGCDQGTATVHIGIAVNGVVNEYDEVEYAAKDAGDVVALSITKTGFLNVGDSLYLMIKSNAQTDSLRVKHFKMTVSKMN